MEELKQSWNVVCPPGCVLDDDRYAAIREWAGIGVDRGFDDWLGSPEIQSQLEMAAEDRRAFYEDQEACRKDPSRKDPSRERLIHGMGCAPMVGSMIDHVREACNRR